MSEIARIIDQLEREHAGDPWHGSPLMSLLEGVTAAEASRRVAPGAHSIWELVLHVTGWRNEVRRRLSGAPAAEPEEGDWPAVGEPSEARWREALAALDAAHRALVAAVAKMPEATLHQPSNDPRDRPLGGGVSYYALLHGLVQHDVYHGGQVGLIKKVLQGSTGFG